MEIEYPSSKARQNGYDFAYLLTEWEREIIAESLIPMVQKRDRKIISIINSPKNEGQVRYQAQVDDLRNEIYAIKEIIKTFSK